MKRKQIIYSLALAGLMCMATTSCTDEKDYGKPLEAAKMLTNPQMNVGDNLSLAVGMQKQIEVVIPDSVTHPVINWTSSNKAVATISPSGLVEAKTAGSTTLTLTQDPNNGSLKTVNVTVMPVATAISLSEDELFEKTSKTVQVTTEPADAYNIFKWTSSNESIATVDENGKVKGVTPGTVTITATTLDGSNLSASAEFTVKEIIALEKITLSPIGYDLGVGESGQIGCVLEPSDATVDMLKWSSSNETIATVDENGTVTGVAVGTVSITATDPSSGKAESMQVTVGTGTFNQNFGEGFGKWTYDTKYAEKLDFQKDHVTITMKSSGKFNFPLYVIPATFNAGTYRYLAVKLLRPAKYILNNNSQGTIFLDMSYVGRYMNGQNNYSIVGYEDPKKAPEDKPVVIYFDLQKNFGANWYLKTDGDQKQDKGLRFGIYDIPNTFNNVFDLYWVHTFKTLEEMENFVKNNN